MILRSFVFSSHDKNSSFFRCHIPNCDNATTSYNEAFVDFAIPSETDDFGQSSPSSCKRYASVKGEDYCGEKAFNKSKTVECSSYVWDHSEFDETVVSEVSFSSLKYLFK